MGLWLGEGGGLFQVDSGGVGEPGSKDGTSKDGAKMHGEAEGNGEGGSGRGWGV